MEQLKISIKRIATKTDYTIGRLYVNGKLFCDTLENTDRGLDQKMTLEELQKRKVYGKTASVLLLFSLWKVRETA